MTAEDVWAAAKARGDTPDNMTLPEKCLYFTALNIYTAFDNGSIGNDEAKQLKREAIRQFNIMQAGERSWNEQLKVNVALSSISKSIELDGCDKCKKLLRLLDRRISADEVINTGGNYES